MVPPKRLLKVLFKDSPYENFPLVDYPQKEGGWHSESSVFDKLIADIQPELVIEVGTWLGASALRMADKLKAQSSDARVLCVDTWLGAAEFWDCQSDPERYEALDIKHGFPSVFYQFIANILHAGAQDTVVPFPQTSANAAVWLKKRNITSKLIYIDGSHEEADVYADLTAYWPLLEVGGVIFGDDYDAFWPGVIISVNRFAVENGLEAEVGDGFWQLRKETAVTKPKLTQVDELAALRAENAILRAHLTSSILKTDHLVDQIASNNFFVREVQEEKARAGHFWDLLKEAEAEIERLKKQ
ncbi:class I SAM-dependent methyltransferase [Rubellicoccus peritrichatus]|uniref:Class I SAM-dependent methyltransferase n=1 Tax=Rubellicoccus peritrichatus TaxID=3080537 RepID=A0AAQ3QUK8_9BACT|nr:class I SAM-dependent methyltransferase [Puniceicoccus sp. CR14]WOO39842.1 class I SAM-dependent methyltransferase [Puniceicoccus sp. CR14]